MRPHRLVFVLSIGLVSGLLAACASANPGWTYQPAPSVTPPPSVDASAEPSASGDSGDSGTIQSSATGLAFEQAEVNVPAGEPFTIDFTNNDAGTPHNVAIHRESATGEEVFKGEIFNGVETRTYDVPALDACAYAFVCTVHPTMVGTMTAG
jgi:plastocyanin